MAALIVRGASRRGAPLSINLDRVALSRELIEGVNTCVQDFVRDRLFMQKRFFSDSVMSMRKDAVAVADSVTVNEEFNPWSVFGDAFNQQFVSDLKSSQEKVVMRRRASRDTSERWFGAQNAGSPSAWASPGRSGVRISDIVEEGRVDYVAVAEPTDSSSHSVKSPVIGSKRKAYVSSGPMCWKLVLSPVPLSPMQTIQVSKLHWIVKILGLVAGVGVIDGHLLFSLLQRRSKFN